MVLEDTDESDEEEIVGACVPCKKLNVSPLCPTTPLPAPRSLSVVVFWNLVLNLVFGLGSD